MKIRILLFTILCAALSAQVTRAADRPTHDDDDDMTELGEHMEKMGHAFKKLAREVADPAKKDDALKQVQIMHEQAEAALHLQPEKTADLPKYQQQEFVDKYQAGIKALIGDIDRAGAALKADDHSRASEMVNILKKDMDDGHRKFRKKKDDM